MEKNIFNEKLEYNKNFKISYFKFRTVKDIENLADDEYITRTELFRFLDEKSKYILWANRRYFRKNLYPILLTDYIEKIKVKGVLNTYFVKKSNLHHFVKFKEWYENIKKLKEHRVTTILNFGRPSETTKICAANMFKCKNCENNDICKKYKSIDSQKQLAKVMNVLFPRIKQTR